MVVTVQLSDEELARLKRITQEETEGGGSGTGGGGGVKPIAVIVIDKDGVRIEPIKGGMATAVEKLSETMPDIAAKLTEKWGDRKKEGEK